jgi:DNA-binding NtrC family response regulator
MAFRDRLDEEVARVRRCGGFLSLPCTDVADARQRVLDTSYSGFFIDVVLRNCLGSELLADVMTIEPRRPAVLMSGQDLDPAMVREALAFGPVVFIAKPMTLADIDSALEMFRRLVPGVRRRGLAKLALEHEAGPVEGSGPPRVP